MKKLFGIQKRSEEEKEKKQKYFLSQKKTEINLNLENILFFKRLKMAEEAFKSKNYELGIILDNVTEQHIYEYLLASKDLLDFSKIEIKTLVFGLNEEHFKDLQLNMKYFDFKSKFLEFIDIMNNDILAANVYDIKSIPVLYLNNELQLNQPLSFENNKNLMYYSLLNYLIPSSKSPLKKYEKSLIRQENSRILNGYLNKMETLNDDQKWNLIFYLISDIEGIKYVSNFVKKLSSNENKEQEFTIIYKSEEIKCQIKSEILYGYNSFKNEVVKIPLINIFNIELIKELLSKTLIKIEKKDDIYDNKDLLECIKIELLNSQNYYTPHLKILIKIIKDILTSKAVDEYIKNFTDHSPSLNPFKNDEYFNLLFDKYVHFVIFKKDNFFGETIRTYHKVFFNVLPFLEYVPLDKNLTRLFNYTLFILVAIHEFLGHLEKMDLYYACKNVKVKTEEFIDMEFDDNFSENLDREMNFLKKEFIEKKTIKFENKIIDEDNNENNQIKLNILDLLTFCHKYFQDEKLDSYLYHYLDESKEDYIKEFEEKLSLKIKDINKINPIEIKVINTINKIIKNILKKKTNEKNLKEGGYIVENILFCSELFSDLDHPSINLALFILNSYNYSSISNLRNASYLYASYRFAVQDKKSYINPINYSFELKQILEELGLTEKVLEKQDEIIFSTIYQDYLEQTINGKNLKKRKKQRPRSRCILSNAFSN